ncbi:hypothetical protein MCAP1_000338 [Malassezia caprae]|uniref:Regulator of phospholipase D SRF1 n=1 Tax=Malassezia caprae TaxID=1381934 RepID=A0AAF0ITW6_9BASI|nr:hypothetical protein MCAP1_000338 [Malassezia caprae]
MTEAVSEKQKGDAAVPTPLHYGNAKPLNLTPIFDSSGLEAQAAPPETVYMDDAVRIPLHSPYTERDWTAWNSMFKASAHRMSRQDAPLRQRAEPLPDRSLSRADHREPHDMVGWAIASKSHAPNEARKTPEDAALTLQYTHSRPWDQPWSFRDALSGLPELGLEASQAASSKQATWKRTVALFFLRNPFVPLLLRIINILLISCSLAVSARLHITLERHGLTYAVGVSPLTGIIFAPPSIVYAMFQVWLEYRSRPIGLWHAGSKLWYMMLELLFVCIWTAELALVFDNYFTSTLVCVNAHSPFYQQPHLLPSEKPIPEKGTLCGLQIAMICVSFVSVVVYVLVFMVSLFRIFYRVMLTSY